MWTASNSLSINPSPSRNTASFFQLHKGRVTVVQEARHGSKVTAKPEEHNICQTHPSEIPKDPDVHRHTERSPGKDPAFTRSLPP
ncbi:hypothetical protein R3I93_013246 [Phoxinus phoxinus]|uniref:Uncharacterized protein n=1 Tax=Phoxinus phoxinus TaxID=58324 RepID=A0AAN9CRI9_9TELE